jgi:Uncharacterized protein conserved in bacteria (DUF2255)
MTTWTTDCRKVAAAEELELASGRRDGTLGNPVMIWVVRVGDDLYFSRTMSRIAAKSSGHACLGISCPIPEISFSRAPEIRLAISRA